MGVSGKLHAPAVFPLERTPVPPDQEAGFGRFSEEKISCRDRFFFFTSVIGGN